MAMRYASKFLGLAVCLSLISACDSVKSVEYYKDNPDKAQKISTECLTKQATGEFQKMSDKQKQNCSNAYKAMIGLRF